MTEAANASVHRVQVRFAEMQRTVSKSLVLDHVYGVGADAEETVVEVYASRLRGRLKPYGIIIRTRRGLGYQMLVESEA